MKKILYFLFFVALSLYSNDNLQNKTKEESLLNEFSDAISNDTKEIEENKPKINNSSKQSENPDISFVINFGAGYFTDENHIIQGGHAIDDNGFRMQGLEMAVEHSIDPFWKFNLNFQFVGMHVEEAYITSLALPFNLQARFGMMNALFGRENNQHLHVLNTINYTLMHSRFLSQEHFSGLAGELSCLMPFSWYNMLIFQVFDTKEGYFRSSSFAKSNISKDGYINGFEDLVYLARLESFVDLTENLSLYWNFSSSFGQSEYSPDNRVTLLGTDLYLKYRPITSGDDDFMVALTVESILRDTQIPNDFIRDYGGYIQLDLHTSKYWDFTLRADYNDILSGNIPQIYKKKFEKESRGTFAISYMPTHFSRIRLQYDIAKKGEDSLYHGFFIQLEGNVGAHGAHSY